MASCIQDNLSNTAGAHGKNINSIGIIDISLIGNVFMKNVYVIQAGKWQCMLYLINCLQTKCVHVIHACIIAFNYGHLVAECHINIVCSYVYS